MGSETRRGGGRSRNRSHRLPLSGILAEDKLLRATRGFMGGWTALFEYSFLLALTRRGKEVVHLKRSREDVIRVLIDGEF